MIVLPYILLLQFIVVPVVFRDGQIDGMNIDTFARGSRQRAILPGREMYDGL